MGFLTTKLRNVRAAIKKDRKMLLSQSGLNHTSENQSITNESNIELENTIDDEDSSSQEEQMKNDVAFLKNAIVNNEQIETIQQKIVSTLEYRIKMMDELKMDVLENFPYFFVYPWLVRTFETFPQTNLSIGFNIDYDFRSRSIFQSASQ